MKRSLIFFSMIALLLSVSCSPEQEAVAELDIEATVISLDDQFDNAGIEFKVGGMTVLAFLDDLSSVQYAYVKTHKDKVPFSVDIKAVKDGYCGSSCNGVHFTFYLLGKKVETVVQVMEYEQFIKIKHKIPTFRYTIIDGKKVDNLKLEKIK